MNRGHSGQGRRLEQRLGRTSSCLREYGGNLGSLREGRSCVIREKYPDGNPFRGRAGSPERARKETLQLRADHEERTAELENAIRRLKEAEELGKQLPGSGDSQTGILVWPRSCFLVRFGHFGTVVVINVLLRCKSQSTSKQTRQSEPRQPPIQQQTSFVVQKTDCWFGSITKNKRAEKAYSSADSCRWP